jgi:NADH-quinone oxidoreductase subunit F
MNLELYVHASAGRYICGEASAMLNALEGRRPIPRHKPPHMSTEGFFGKPTVVNNAETLFSVPPIIVHGAQWYLGLGRTAEGGTKIFTVSGKVNNPGVWELPLGITIREVLEQYAGGMRSGLKLRALMPGRFHANLSATAVARPSKRTNPSMSRNRRQISKPHCAFPWKDSKGSRPRL